MRKKDFNFKKFKDVFVYPTITVLKRGVSLVMLCSLSVLAAIGMITVMEKQKKEIDASYQCESSILKK